ncbi:MAG: hypothetical protein PVH88_27315 [Ignavibacteria bacterium]|jgi:hypothetical protein
MIELGKQQKAGTSDNTGLKGLIKLDNITVDWNTNIYPLEIVSKIFDLKLGEIS